MILLLRLDTSTPAPLDLCLLEDAFDLFEDNTFCPKERNALSKFFKLSEGETWINNSNWDKQYITHCDWHGIDCNENDSFINISLSNNDMAGCIDPSINKLKQLVRIDLSGNDIGGQIPSEFGQLTALSYIRLNHNALSGSIPSNMIQLRNISKLFLQGNKLSGNVTVEKAMCLHR